MMGVLTGDARGLDCSSNLILWTLAYWGLVVNYKKGMTV